MTHGRKRFKLGRSTKQRKALVKNLANSLILHERIETSLAKAKFLKSFLEKLVTKAKLGTLSSRRQIAAALGNGLATRKMIEVVGPVFKNRGGGYLKINRLGVRSGDSTPIVLITFSEDVTKVAAKVTKKEELLTPKTKETKSRKTVKITKEEKAKKAQGKAKNEKKPK